MDIKAFIRELLFGHECVIVPGFGGFIGNHSEARIDRMTGTFYPPTTGISFNRNLNHNDGLLISKISLSTGVNYGDARHIVEEFVRDITGRLLRGEKVVFDHIGTFANNRENNVQFEPEANINYHLDSYGLESFQCYPVKDYDVRKRIIRHIDKEPVRYPVRKTLWRAAVVIPILALIVLIPLKTDLFKAKVESTSLNPLVTAEFENNRKAVDEAVSLAPDSGITVNPVETVPGVQPGVAPAEAKIYGVITGSFKSEENARTHIEDLKAEGFVPEMVQAASGFFRIYAMSCNDLETAVHKKDSLSKKFPGSWVSRR